LFFFLLSGHRLGRFGSCRNRDSKRRSRASAAVGPRSFRVVVSNAGENARNEGRPLQTLRRPTSRTCAGLFPHVAEHVDDLALIRSMHALSPARGPALFQMNTGTTLAGHPSVGRWITFGLGTANQNLPGFIVFTDYCTPRSCT
jgi:hypothetical protein